MSQEPEKSAFHAYRSRYQPRTPLILREFSIEGVETPADVPTDIGPIFPKTV